MAIRHKLKCGVTLTVDPEAENITIGLEAPGVQHPETDRYVIEAELEDLQELNEVIHVIATGEAYPKCEKCGCEEDKACMLVNEDGVTQTTCGWDEVGDRFICTACAEDAPLVKAGFRWKHPADQEEDDRASMMDS